MMAFARGRVWGLFAAGVTASAGCSDAAEPKAARDEALVWPQHTTWTVARGAPRTYRVVAYGDSIFAGFQGSPWDVARRAAPYVAGEYLATSWDANVEVVRRAVTGGLASEVKAAIVTDRAYMEDPSTRAVYFEMCGNDYLGARGAFDPAGAACNRAVLDAALRACVSSTELAMQAIKEAAATAQVKAVVNLYYPGFDADDGESFCTDPATGQRANIQRELLPMIARSNWRTCDLARRNGFACVDAFAEFMAADWDTNGDGKIDSEAIRFDPDESEEDYVKKIVVTLRSTIKDANKHSTAPGAQFNYLHSDNCHPLAFLESVSSGTTGTSAPDFAHAVLASGANPHWNQYGHERMGWALWQASPKTLR